MYEFNEKSNVIGPKSSIVDIKEAKEKLNFVAKIKLEDYIKIEKLKFGD